MRDVLPFILIAIGLLLALNTYQNIRRGGARFYTLEREAMLRQASVTLVLTVLLLLGAVGVMYLNQQQESTTAEPTSELVEEDASNPQVTPGTPTADDAIEQFPPTFTPAPTLD